MKTIEKHQIETDIVMAFTCDVCKKEYSNVGVDDVYEIQEMIHINKVCGYGTIFEDFAYIDLDICQHCFKKIIDKFNIKLEY